MKMVGFETQEGGKRGRKRMRETQEEEIHRGRETLEKREREREREPS